MRNRRKQRGNGKMHREERLDTRNDEGYLDRTAFLAVARITDHNKKRQKPASLGQTK